jgi:hypothetical protein
MFHQTIDSSNKISSHVEVSDLQSSNKRKLFHIQHDTTNNKNNSNNNANNNESSVLADEDADLNGMTKFEFEIPAEINNLVKKLKPML